MASSYNSDDTWRVVEDHVRQAIQADTKLGSGGDLEIKSWEEQPREDFNTYQSNLLPACSVNVEHQAVPEDVAIGDHVDYVYATTIILVFGGGEYQTVIGSAKYTAARVVRVLQQQHHSGKQLVDLPSDLDGGQTGEVEVQVSNVDVSAGNLESNPTTLRGYVEITALISVGFIVPED